MPITAESGVTLHPYYCTVWKDFIFRSCYYLLTHSLNWPCWNSRWSSIEFSTLQQALFRTCPARWLHPSYFGCTVFSVSLFIFLFRESSGLPVLPRLSLRRGWAARESDNGYLVAFLCMGYGVVAITIYWLFSSKYLTNSSNCDIIVLPLPGVNFSLRYYHLLIVILNQSLLRF